MTTPTPMPIPLALWPVAMPATRLPDWPQRLTALVLSRQRSPWRLGLLDCCLWAADAVQATTGTDLASPVRHLDYSDPTRAMGLLRALGGLRGVAGRVGQPIAPARALEGDVAIIRQAGRPMLAVCGGRHWLVVSNQGLLALPWDAPLAAWGVAHA